MILNYNLQKVKTILNKPVRIKLLMRFMETNAHVPLNNALIEYFRNENDVTLEQQASNITDYIIANLQEELLLSQIVEESANSLGYYIHPESFIGFLEATRNRLNREGGTILQDFDKGLEERDDLNLYTRNNNADLQLQSDAKKSYMDFIDVLYRENNPTPFISNNENSDNSSSSFSDDDTVPEGYTAEYYRIPCSDTSSNISSDSNSSEEVNFNYNDNSQTVLLYTIAAFIVIQGIAWYVRTYHKDSLADTTEDQQENILHSVYEHSFFYQHLFLQFILFIIPLYFLFIYNFRYYYLYKFYFKLKDFFSHVFKF